MAPCNFCTFQRQMGQPYGWHGSALPGKRYCQACYSALSGNPYWHSFGKATIVSFRGLVNWAWVWLRWQGNP